MAEKLEKELKEILDGLIKIYKLNVDTADKIMDISKNLIAEGDSKSPKYFMPFMLGVRVANFSIDLVENIVSDKRLGGEFLDMWYTVMFAINELVSVLKGIETDMISSVLRNKGVTFILSYKEDDNLSNEELVRIFADAINSKEPINPLDTMNGINLEE